MEKAVRDTSVLSYEEIRESLGARQSYVLDLIELNPRRTDRELAEIAGTADPNMIRPRRSELVAKGLVIESGHRHCSVTGKLSTTWEAAGPSGQMELF